MFEYGRSIFTEVWNGKLLSFFNVFVFFDSLAPLNWHLNLFITLINDSTPVTYRENFWFRQNLEKVERMLISFYLHIFSNLLLKCFKVANFQICTRFLQSVLGLSIWAFESFDWTQKNVIFTPWNCQISLNNCEDTLLPLSCLDGQSDGKSTPLRDRDRSGNDPRRVPSFLSRCSQLYPEGLRNKSELVGSEETRQVWTGNPKYETEFFWEFLSHCRVIANA